LIVLTLVEVMNEAFDSFFLKKVVIF